MAYERRSFVGGGAATALTGNINASVESFSIADATNWPTGSGGDFFVVIGRGTATEEKVRCQTRSSLAVTVRSGGRAADGTSAALHNSGDTVELCVTALDLDEANAHLSNQQADPHPMYLTSTEGDAAYQVKDATLTALSGANWAANALPIGTGSDTLSQTAFAANTFPARSSSGNLVAKTITDFGLSLIDDADAATALLTLGVTSAKAFNATVLAGETTSSSSYTDLATPGPAVTVTTGTKALVTVATYVVLAGGTGPGYMGCVVSGASTVAASDAQGVGFSSANSATGSRTFLLTGLTAGSNTFTAKYRSNSGAVGFAGREIIVQPVA